MKNREQWASNLGFILATTGAAVGLGNIWRFPYMVGSNGGSAFVLVYLICVIAIGLPVMMAEILMGRRAKRDFSNTMVILAREANASLHWKWLSGWGAFGLLLILSFYSVVSGWALAYLFYDISGQFQHLNAEQISAIWTGFLAKPYQLLLWHSLFMGLTLFVVARGVQKGLELAGRIMLPILFLVLAILVLYATTTPGFSEAVSYLFSFNFKKITPAVTMNAMGHAFFTLGLGVGAMLVYGSYVKKQVNITKAVFIIATLDILVAVLSGLSIYPLIFSHHLSPTGGAGLMFVTLPIAFAHMSHGILIGALFFILLIFAAWTSSINLAEPLVDMLVIHQRMTRPRAALVTGFIAWFIGIGSVLSFNVWKNVIFFHRWTFFDLSTDIPTNIILPLGGFFFAIFAGYVMSKKSTKEELALRIPYGYTLWRFLIRTVAPVGILMVFIASIWTF